MKLPDEMTPEEMSDREDAADELAQEIVQFVSKKGSVRQDVAALAFIAVMMNSFSMQFGEEAANELGNLISQFILRKMKEQFEGRLPPDPEEVKFWNLMAEGYDKPVAFSKKAKAASRGAK